jgi:hypothetical protein
MIEVRNPANQFFDKDGSPLDDGYIYIGTQFFNPETSPQAVFWDKAGTIPAAQPIRTINGYPARSGSPSKFYTASKNYSVTVKDKRGSLIVGVTDSDSGIFDELSEVGTAALIGYDNATGLFASNVQDALDDLKDRIDTTSIALSSNRELDLRTGLDFIYGVNGWDEYSGTPGSGSDIGPAITHLLNLTSGRSDIFIPPGLWRMATPPSASDLSGNRIIGAGSQASGIVYDNNTGVAFFFSGAGGFTGGGISGLSIQLESGYPSSTAQAIRLEGNATYQPDQMVFEDIYISALGASYWNAGFFAYGNSRTTPQGIRVCTVKNMQIFRCNTLGFYLSNVVQMSGENIGVYSGTGAGRDIYIAGGGSSLTNSIQTYIRGATAQSLNITNASKFEISGTFSTFATAISATDGRVLGFGATLSGTLGANVTLSA